MAFKASPPGRKHRSAKVGEASQPQEILFLTWALSVVMPFDVPCLVQDQLLVFS